MSSEHAPTTLTLERLWQFSLSYYSARGVKDACLTLQNQYHGNVNLLLLLKWLDEQQLAFEESEWHHIQQCLSRSESLLLSYRELRKHLKPHVVDSLYHRISLGRNSKSTLYRMSPLKPIPWEKILSELL